jgi:hypothetical protein
MTFWHRVAAYAATLGALALLAGALWGGNDHFTVFGLDRTVRQVLVGLYSFLLPIWFALEQACWEPDKNDPNCGRFRRGQRIFRIIWIVIGGGVGIIVASPKC